jgi:hypothetical protein
MILMASRQVTSSDFNTHGIREDVCPFGGTCHSEDAAGGWREKVMITMVFTTKKHIMIDVLPRSSTFNQLYFINNIFPYSKSKPEFSAPEGRVNFWGAYG